MKYTRHILGLLLSLGALCAGLSLTPASALANAVHEYSSSFGLGAAPGQVKNPRAVAVNEVALGQVGDVYVADREDNRVDWFTPQGTEFKGSFSVSRPDAIAVDNSTNSLDPSRGDVYVISENPTTENEVVEKFLPNGVHVGTIEKGLGGVSFHSLGGVAVDPEGVVWVAQGEGEIDSYSSAEANVFLSSVTSPVPVPPEAGGFAVDAHDDLYVRNAKLNSAGEILIDSLSTEFVQPADAVDQATGEVYIATEYKENEQAISAFNAAEACTASTPCPLPPANSLLQQFGAGHLFGVRSTAVDAAVNVLYVVDEQTRRVEVYRPTLLPLLESEVLGAVGVSGATIDAQVNAHGSPTTIHVEYGTTTGYGSSTPEVGVAGSESVPEQLAIAGLAPDTTYHARVVAGNESGTFHGRDFVFTTDVAGDAGTPPDGRAYELVSGNAATERDVYIQDPVIPTSEVKSQAPFRAAADGNSVAYAAEAPPTGGAGSSGEDQGDDFKGTRTANGWNSTDLMAPRAQNVQYEGFSGDLAVGVLGEAAQPPLTVNAPANCDVLYLRTAADEGFHPAFTGTQTPEECGTPLYVGTSADDSHVIFESEAILTPTPGAQSHPRGSGEYNLYESVGESAYLVNVLPDGKPATRATFGYPDPRVGDDFERVISPDGSRIVWADLDIEPGPENPAGTTRLFVRENAQRPSASTVQVDAAVGGGGRYMGASANDSIIYFTKEEKLYQYNVESAATTDLTPGGGVVGVAGISEDGAEVYPVAKTVLATNTNSEGEAAHPGDCTMAQEEEPRNLEEVNEEEAGVLVPGRACNLYALHVGGVTRFVAALLPSDNGYREERAGTVGSAHPGDWSANLESRSAELDRSGHVLAFTSRRTLTGYDNRTTVPPGRQDYTLHEIFVYDTEDEQLSCVSCNPSGEPSVPVLHTGYEGEQEETEENYAPIPVSRYVSPGSVAFQYRWVSANGNRVFFDSTEPLVPQDTNKAMDVYEWERAGEGSCTTADGCIYLISGTGGDSEAYFGDASENGGDVFFSSRADLLPEDSGENVVLYDARVGGGFPHPAQACTGTGCQGVPSAPPIFATPASATFAGTGNFPSSSAPKASTKKTVRCAKGKTRNKHGDCVKPKKPKKSKPKKTKKVRRASRDRRTK